MSNSLWDLPGPSYFVNNVIEDLRGGKNVVLCFPHHISYSSLLQKIKISCSDECRTWHRFSENLEGDSPTSILFEKYVPNSSSDGLLLDIFTLCKQDNFQGRLICLEFSKRDCWVKWKDFLVDYEATCRKYSLFERTLFLVILSGNLATDPPQSDACLSVYQWLGVVNELDIMFHTTKLLQPRQMHPFHKRLAIAMVTNLSLWDFEICQKLSNGTYKEILEPKSTLEEIAIERNWDQIPYEADNLWQNGILQKIEECEQRHPAFLAVHNREKEFNHFIWRAQISIVFPYIEEQRQKLLQQLDKVLEIPFTTKLGIVENIWDIEINHIDYQLKNNLCDLKFNNRRLISYLKKIRNKLAHSEPVPSDFFLDRCFKNPFI